jgi:hypothetical protein
VNTNCHTGYASEKDVRKTLVSRLIIQSNRILTCSHSTCKKNTEYRYIVHLIPNLGFFDFGFFYRECPSHDQLSPPICSSYCGYGKLVCHCAVLWFLLMYLCLAECIWHTSARSSRYSRQHFIHFYNIAVRRSANVYCLYVLMYIKLYLCTLLSKICVRSCVFIVYHHLSYGLVSFTTFRHCYIVYFTN